MIEGISLIFFFHFGHTGGAREREREWAGGGWVGWLSSDNVAFDFLVGSAQVSDLSVIRELPTSFLVRTTFQTGFKKKCQSLRRD